LVEVSGRANLVSRFEQSVHQTAQIAARDVRARRSNKGSMRKSIGSIQVQFHLIFPLSLR